MREGPLSNHGHHRPGKSGTAARHPTRPFAGVAPSPKSADENSDDPPRRGAPDQRHAASDIWNKPKAPPIGKYGLDCARRLAYLISQGDRAMQLPTELYHPCYHDEAAALV